MTDKLDGAETRADVWDTALEFLPALGLSKVVFVDLSQAAAPNILSNAEQSWTDSYTSIVRAGDDPFAINCLTQVAPVLTGIGHMEAHSHLDADALEQIAQGSDALDIQTGISVTISPHWAGAGIGWNLMTSHNPREFAQLRDTFEAQWRAWCQVTYAGLSHTTTIAPALSPRERDCLALIADGFRNSDIAHRLGIAETTVEMHIRNARQRLKAKTRDHAVVLAVRAGLV